MNSPAPRVSIVTVNQILFRQMRVVRSISSVIQRFYLRDTCKGPTRTTFLKFMIRSNGKTKINFFILLDLQLEAEPNASLSKPVHWEMQQLIVILEDLQLTKEAI